MLSSDKQPFLRRKALSNDSGRKFLKFRKSEPRDFYKTDSYKKSVYKSMTLVPVYPGTISAVSLLSPFGWGRNDSLSAVFSSVNGTNFSFRVCL